MTGEVYLEVGKEDAHRMAAAYVEHSRCALPRPTEAATAWRKLRKDLKKGISVCKRGLFAKATLDLALTHGGLKDAVGLRLLERIHMARGSQNCRIF